MVFPLAAAAIGAAGSIGGGILASNAAGKAADAQTRTSEAAIAEQRRQFDITQNRLAPFADTAGRANAAIAYELGLGPRPQRQGWEAIPEVERIRRSGGQGGRSGGGRPENAFADIADPFARARAEEQAAAQGQAAVQRGTGGGQGGGPRFRVGDQTFDTRRDARDARREMFDDRAPEDSFNYRGFRTTPGYQFRFDEGLDAMQATLAAGGMAGSGAALKAATRYGQGVASEEYGNYFNRLAGTARQPQTAQLGQFGAQTAGNVGNLLMQGGQAQAQGFANQGNIISGTLNDLANIGGQYFGAQAPQMTPSTQSMQFGSQPFPSYVAGTSSFA